MAAFSYSVSEAAGVEYAVTASLTAPDNQLHATVVEQLAPAAVASGLWDSAGDFAIACRDKPFGTLLAWIKFHVDLSTSLPAT